MIYRDRFAPESYVTGRLACRGVSDGKVLGSRISRRSPVCLCALLLACEPALAQLSLTLSSTSANPGTTVGLTMSLAAGSPAPAGLEWTFSYPTTQVSAISATAGAASAAAGKALACGSLAGSFRCLASGLNTNGIGTGVIANVQVTLMPNAGTTWINVVSPVGVDATGTGLSPAAAGGVVIVPAVSSVACSPASLSGGGTSTCTAIISQAAPPGGSTLSLASDNSLLAVPSTVIVAAGTTAATFTVNAGAMIPSNQGATVKATLGGSSQIFTVNLLASVVVSSIVCNPGGLMSGGAATCSVTLSRPVSSSATVSLNSNSGLLSVPGVLIVPAGSSTGSVSATAGTVSANGQAVVTAVFGGSSQSTTISLWPTPTLLSLACTPTRIAVGSAASCSVLLSQAAGNLSISVTSTNPALAVPAFVNVDQNTSSATFDATAVATASGWIVLTTSYNGVSKALSLIISAAHSHISSLKAVACSPRRLGTGTHALCEVQFDTAPDSQAGDLELASSSDSLRLPATIRIRPGQSTARFRIDAVTRGTTATITAKLADDIVRETVTLDSGSDPPEVPAHLYAKVANQVQFRVSSPAAGTTYSVSNPPAGAVLNSASGYFQWTPDVSQQGTHTLVFTATSPSGDSVAAPSIIEVDSGTPVITNLVNAASRSQDAACSSGAIARLEGKWLVDGPAVSDPTGNSTELSGTSVAVNGIAVPVLSVSESRVDFLCPATAPGISLDIQLQTSRALAPPIQTISRETALGIFSIDESGEGQGAVLHSGTMTVAMTPNYRYASGIALSGDSLTIYATGIGDAHEVSIAVDEIEIRPQSIAALSGAAGVYQINMVLPDGLTKDNLPISLRVRMLDGSTVTSNKVWVASETSR